MRLHAPALSWRASPGCAVARKAGPCVPLALQQQLWLQQQACGARGWLGQRSPACLPLFLFYHLTYLSGTFCFMT